MKTNIVIGLILVACACIWWARQPVKIEHRTRQLEAELEQFELRVMTGRP